MSANTKAISLDGGWQADLGAGFKDVPVPGCWEQLGGSKRFAGPVVYRREVVFPAARDGERIELSFGAVSYACELFVNGRSAGAHEGMWDSFAFDVTGHVRPGEPNELRLVVEKPGYSTNDRFPLRDVLSGFIPDVQCTFGGIWGRVELRRGPAAHPGENVSVRCRGGTAELVVEIANDSAAPVSADVEVRLSRAGREVFAGRHAVRPGPGITMLSDRFPLDGVDRWRLEDPALHDLDVIVRSEAGEDALHRRVGIREIRADGQRILLNGEPVYLRGALHWGYFPDRIAPLPTASEIRRELGELRGLGFNAVKHCLWVPRDEYYALCDEMGFLAWLEMPLWLPRMTPALEARMAREYPRIVAQVAHHACIVAYSLGCELGADVAGPILERLSREVREMTGGALVRDNSGSGECYGGLAVDYSDFYDYHFYAEPHILESLLETFTPAWRPTRPWLFGEYADADTWRVVPTGKEAPWWSSPDPDVNPVSSLKPDFRLHLQPGRLAAPGIAGRSRDLAAASREHALLHRKLSIESTRAFPQTGGYNITAIRDVPISTSGIFDDAGRSKFEPVETRPFNADLVLVPRWDLSRVWIRGDRVREADRFSAQAGDEWAMRIVASNFGPRIPAGRWSWSLADAGGGTIASATGELGFPLERGETRELCRMAALIPHGSAAVRLAASVSLIHAAGRVENEWPIFAWPDAPARFPPGAVALLDPLGILEPMRGLFDAVDYDAVDLEDVAGRAAVVAATSFDEPLRRHVSRGGRALIVQRGRGAFAHESVGFWREGFAVFEDHPVAAAVPAGLFRELALYGVATDTALGWITPGGEVRAVRPVISRLDARESIAQHYMVELSFGEGKLIVTTLRLEGGMGKQPSGLAGNSAARFLLERALRHLLQA